MCYNVVISGYRFTAVPSSEPRKLGPGVRGAVLCGGAAGSAVLSCPARVPRSAPGASLARPGVPARGFRAASGSLLGGRSIVQ
jgi:hypothetical protein